MTKTVTWAEITTKYLALLDSNIDTDKAKAKNFSYSQKYHFGVKYEIRKMVINGKEHEVRNGFVIYE